uniref:Uncharacterized protein n=1 Tax=Ascaris lumbricoides TaxID=6252 RepID=A0A0M3HI17_ASCLU
MKTLVQLCAEPLHWRQLRLAGFLLNHMLVRRTTPDAIRVFRFDFFQILCVD